MGQRVEEIYLCSECGCGLSEACQKIFFHICVTYVAKKKVIFKYPPNGEHDDVNDIVFELEQKGFIASTDCSPSLVSIKPLGYSKFDVVGRTIHFFCIQPRCHESIEFDEDEDDFDDALGSEF